MTKDFCTSSVLPPSIDQEAVLVRLVINALQGVKSSLVSIEMLSAAFCSDPADRTFHRIPSLWHRSSSTNALGNILKSIGHSGLVFHLLYKFVDYFLVSNFNIGGKSGDNKKRRAKQVGPEFAESDTVTLNSEICHGDEMGSSPPYSLVNQAFSIAVGKVLEGYLCALNTLYSSVHLRHSLKNVNVPTTVSPDVGCFTSVVHSEISVLEVYLHTEELRTRIESLGNICFFRNADIAFSMSSVEDLTAEITLQFNNFPRGAELLTYLYVQLRDADPVHRALLKFLFIRSCEPYIGFIKSWIYQARINDPYAEFIVEHLDGSSPYFHGKAGSNNGSSLASIKERDGVTVPCFVKDVCLPLFRAGQQLKVLLELLDMCSLVTGGDHSYGRVSHLSFHLGNLEDILPYWNSSSSGFASWSSLLTFSKRNIEAMKLKRETMYRVMQEKLKNLFPRLNVRYWKISSSVIPFCKLPLILDSKRNNLNFPTPLLCDESLMSTTSTANKEVTNLGAGAADSDSSSLSDDFLSEPDQLQSSESSSLSNFEAENNTEGSMELHNILVATEHGDSSTPGFSTYFANKSIFHIPPGSERLWPLECASQGTCKMMDPNPIIVHGHPHQKEMELTQSSLPLHLGDPKMFRASETVDTDYLSGTCWPLGSLRKNPFSAHGECRSQTQLQFNGCSQKLTEKNMESLTTEDSYCGKIFGSENSDLELSIANACSHQSWSLRYDYNFLSINPMLTRNAWFQVTHSSRNRGCMDNKKSDLSYFDFSSVEDLSKMYGERLHAQQDNRFQTELPLFTDSRISSGKGVNEYSGEGYHDGDGNPVDQVDQPVLPCRNSQENLQEEYLPTGPYGGAKWESLLSYCGKDVMHSSEGHEDSSVTGFEIPLDVIVDQCIVQEILLQYKYVSDFTIKFLEEVFDLRGHLLALRRYHFMELADWADIFIMSLRHHKWHISEANQRISEIQGLLDLAIQRSSCESDLYKERLFVYMKGDSMMPSSTGVVGLRAFDFIALGYRVDWPINIVLTPNALKIYAEIFNFLTQIKLAVFSLTDIWRSLKDLMHLISHNQGSVPDEREMKYFNILMKMRQQVNHFVSTLQQYVQSQLSHVSWCRLLHSLKHQVKDMLDLESVHMTYLADSLHICFLSVETQTVACIIKSILQCALDFRACFAGGGLIVGSNGEGTLELLSRINFSRVLSTKATFEGNLKELYLCYLNSPKHNEFGLWHFWEHLNYNDYFSNIISRGTG
ncbi:spc97 / Spc98 family of spindle pole body (SBP) component [Tasmannia lanceolata]|uniref:spc97 / Spc98 family of spindle pole body (SBP) component n=1 Tax=Tasmannia lanceolata TaxID=3420 RepID=UPI00406436CF